MVIIGGDGDDSRLVVDYILASILRQIARPQISPLQGQIADTIQTAAWGTYSQDSLEIATRQRPNVDIQGDSSWEIPEPQVQRQSPLRFGRRPALRGQESGDFGGNSLFALRLRSCGAMADGERRKIRGREESSSGGQEEFRAPKPIIGAKEKREKKTPQIESKGPRIMPLKRATIGTLDASIKLRLISTPAWSKGPRRKPSICRGALQRRLDPNLQGKQKKRVRNWNHNHNLTGAVAWRVAKGGQAKFVVRRYRGALDPNGEDRQPKEI
ncbi:hypothetical protein K438DRAFT_1947821 [Mycena galopus ATCC 62051]|nr:hypothetical protein K438DRAFT_1947821 [Mycena galopus ATCC 62051]